MNPAMNAVANHYGVDDYGAAIAFYTHAIEDQPDIVESYWYLGLAWLLQGDEAAAQTVWITALAQAAPDQADQLTTDLADLLIAEATRQCQHHRPDQASRLYQQVLELQPDAAEIQLALGNILAEQGDLTSALVSWQTATTLQPEWIEPVERQAEVWQKLGQIEQAIACYHQALTLRPDRADFYHLLGLCYTQQAQWEMAIAQFSQMLQRQPQCAAAWGDLGYAQLRRGNLETAIAHFQLAVQMQPHTVETYCNWVKQGTAAVALQLNADFLQSLLPTATVDCSDASGEFDEREKRAECISLPQLQPQTKQYGYLGTLLSQRGQPELAIAAYQTAVTLQPSAVQFHLELGHVLTQVNQLDAAFNAYQTVLQLTPNSTKALLGIGRILVKFGQYQEAIALANQAIALAPIQPDGYILLGDVARLRGQWDESAKHYQTALKLAPTAIECWCNLAIALAHSHRDEEAIACFKTILNLNSNLAPVVWNFITSLQTQALLAPSATLAQITPIDAPIGWHETTEEWIHQTSLNANDYIPIHPPQTVILTPPKQIETNSNSAPHFSFRFGRKITIPKTFLVTLANGRFWLDPDQSSSAIFTKNNQILADLSPEFPILSPGHPDQQPGQHWTFRAEKLSPPELIQGNVVVLAGLSNNVYFHWLLDCLPRFELLQLSGVDLTEVDYFLVGDRQPFQQESLAMLGIPNSKILPIEQHLHIQATQLIVPSFPGAIAWFQPWVGDFLKATFLNQVTDSFSDQPNQSNYPTRLYISRQNTTTRRVINESELVQYLEQFGFVSIDLEALSIVEQAQLFASAEVIVASHGSGLTNAIFCAPSTKIIEIFSPNFVYSCYWYISNVIKLDYFYLLGDLPLGYSMHQFLYPNPRIEDIFVNLNTLKKILDVAGIA